MTLFLVSFYLHAKFNSIAHKRNPWKHHRRLFGILGAKLQCRLISFDATLSSDPFSTLTSWLTISNTMYTTKERKAYKIMLERGGSEVTKVDNTAIFISIESQKQKKRKSKKRKEDVVQRILCKLKESLGVTADGSCSRSCACKDFRNHSARISSHHTFFFTWRRDQ